MVGFGGHGNTPLASAPKKPEDRDAVPYQRPAPEAGLPPAVRSTQPRGGGIRGRGGRGNNFSPRGRGGFNPSSSRGSPRGRGNAQRARGRPYDSRSERDGSGSRNERYDSRSDGGDWDRRSQSDSWVAPKEPSAMRQNGGGGGGSSGYTGRGQSSRYEPCPRSSYNDRQPPRVQHDSYRGDRSLSPSYSSYRSSHDRQGGRQYEDERDGPRHQRPRTPEGGPRFTGVRTYFPSESPSTSRSPSPSPNDRGSSAQSSRPIAHQNGARNGEDREAMKDVHIVDASSNGRSRNDPKADNPFTLLPDPIPLSDLLAPRSGPTGSTNGYNRDSSSPNPAFDPSSGGAASNEPVQKMKFRPNIPKDRKGKGKEVISTDIPEPSHAPYGEQDSAIPSMEAIERQMAVDLFTARYRSILDDVQHSDVVRIVEHVGTNDDAFLDTLEEFKVAQKRARGLLPPASHPSDEPRYTPISPNAGNAEWYADYSYKHPYQNDADHDIDANSESHASYASHASLAEHFRFDSGPNDTFAHDPDSHPGHHVVASTPDQAEHHAAITTPKSKKKAKAERARALGEANVISANHNEDVKPVLPPSPSKNQPLDVKPDLSILNDAEARRRAEVARDVDEEQMEGACTFRRKDYKYLWNCSSGDREIRREKFKAMQSSNLAAQGKQLDVVFWRPDGVAFSWKRIVPNTDTSSTQAYPPTSATSAQNGERPSWVTAASQAGKPNTDLMIDPGRSTSPSVWGDTSGTGNALASEIDMLDAEPIKSEPAQSEPQPSSLALPLPAFLQHVPDDQFTDFWRYEVPSRFNLHSSRTPANDDWMQFLQIRANRRTERDEHGRPTREFKWRYEPGTACKLVLMWREAEGVGKPVMDFQGNPLVDRSTSVLGANPAPAAPSSHHALPNPGVRNRSVSSASSASIPLRLTKKAAKKAAAREEVALNASATATPSGSTSGSDPNSAGQPMTKKERKKARAAAAAAAAASASGNGSQPAQFNRNANKTGLPPVVKQAGTEKKGKKQKTQQAEGTQAGSRAGGSNTGNQDPSTTLPARPATGVANHVGTNDNGATFSNGSSANHKGKDQEKKQTAPQSTNGSNGAVQANGNSATMASKPQGQQGGAAAGASGAQSGESVPKKKKSPTKAAKKAAAAEAAAADPLAAASPVTVVQASSSQPQTGSSLPQRPAPSTSTIVNSTPNSLPAKATTAPGVANRPAKKAKLDRSGHALPSFHQLQEERDRASAQTATAPASAARNATPGPGPSTQSSRNGDSPQGPSFLDALASLAHVQARPNYVPVANTPSNTQVSNNNHRSSSTPTATKPVNPAPNVSKQRSISTGSSEKPATSASASASATVLPSGKSERLITLQGEMETKLGAIDNWMSISSDFPERRPMASVMIEELQSELFELQRQAKEEKARIKAEEEGRD